MHYNHAYQNLQCHYNLIGMSSTGPGAIHISYSRVTFDLFPSFAFELDTFVTCIIQTQGSTILQLWVRYSVIQNQKLKLSTYFVR
jgi:hypothetical protein